MDPYQTRIGINLAICKYQSHFMCFAGTQAHPFFFVICRFLRLPSLWSSPTPRATYNPLQNSTWNKRNFEVHCLFCHVYRWLSYFTFICWETLYKFLVTSCRHHLRWTSLCNSIWTSKALTAKDTNIVYASLSIDVSIRNITDIFSFRVNWLEFMLLLLIISGSILSATWICKTKA